LKKQWIAGFGGAGGAGGALVVWGRDRIHFDFGVFRAQLALADWRKIGIAWAAFTSATSSARCAGRCCCGTTKRCRCFSLLGTQVIGFTAVALIGRIADPVRPYLVAKKTGLPLSNQIAVYIVERLFDAASMASDLLLVILLAPAGALPHPEVIKKSATGRWPPPCCGALFLVAVRLAGGDGRFVPRRALRHGLQETGPRRRAQDSHLSRRPGHHAHLL
jgi:hypothetical protein